VNALPDRSSVRPGGESPITVVGAGPAGLASAIALAQSGLAVMVREWHAEVGHRFHGDFQGLENWSTEQDVLDELAEAGIEGDFDCTAVSTGEVFSPDGRSYRIRSARPLYYLVRRGSLPGSLDRALMQQARSAGAELRFSDRVTSVSGTAVLAGGPREAQAIAAGYLFETDMADGDWLAVSEELAPLGYAYLLVHGGCGTVASCMFTGFKEEAEHVRRTVASFEQRAGLRMRNAKPFGGFANVRLPRAAEQGGHLVVGEQAGFQDALAGFGLRYAIRSGLLAARAILSGTDYHTLWQRELLPLLKASMVNRFLYNTLGSPGRGFAIRRLSKGDTGVVLRRFYAPSRLSRALFPLAHRVYRRSLRDPSCDHVDCDCVWCRCAAEANATVSQHAASTASHLLAR
jgi:flavin-dependent dehydrogenase